MNFYLIYCIIDILISYLSLKSITFSNHVSSNDFEKTLTLSGNECTRYAQALGLEIVDADYDHENWLREVAGMENEPEEK